MTAITIAVSTLVALACAYRAGLDRGRAEGVLAGLAAAQEDEPADPISEFVATQRDAAEWRAQ